MFSITNLFALIVIVVTLLVFIYKLIYTYKINKIIQSGEGNGRGLVDLSKMVLIAVIVGLSVYSAILMYVVNDYVTQDNTIPRNNYAVIDVSDEDNYQYISYFGANELNDASFAKVYKKDANEGYDREVIESGEYIFTVFRRTAPADSFHPDFLCFVDFTATDKDEYVCYKKSGFHSIIEESEGFYGETSGDIMDSILYIGYLDQGCEFDIAISLLDNDAEIEYNEAMHKAYEEDKGDFPSAEEFAVSTGKISIRIE